MSVKLFKFDTDDKKRKKDILVWQNFLICSTMTTVSVRELHRWNIRSVTTAVCLRQLFKLVVYSFKQQQLVWEKQPSNSIILWNTESLSGKTVLF